MHMCIYVCMSVFTTHSHTHTKGKTPNSCIETCSHIRTRIRNFSELEFMRKELNQRIHAYDLLKNEYEHLKGTGNLQGVFVCVGFACVQVARAQGCTRARCVRARGVCAHACLCVCDCALLPCLQVARSSFCVCVCARACSVWYAQMQAACIVLMYLFKNAAHAHVYIL
jgi:hypothetical protein